MQSIVLSRALHRALIAAAVIAAAFASPAASAAEPQIAVTDLSYEEKVREHFQSFEMKGRHSSSSSSRESYRDSDYSSSERHSGRSRDSGEISIRSQSGYQTYIDRGELRKFTADIKGGLLNAGYRVVQGKPWTQQNTEKLYDIIDRIKQGYYPGADYVLFGTVSNLEFRRDDSPIQGSDATSYTLSLELVAEFSLIDTRTYEVNAAFSAMGEGSDTKLINAPGAQIHLNRSKVIQEVSRSLGEAVAHEVEAQFSSGSGDRGSTLTERSETVSKERTIIFQ